MDPFSSQNIRKIGDINNDLRGAWHGFKIDTDLQNASFHLAEVNKLSNTDLKADILKLSLNNPSLEQIDTIDYASDTDIDDAAEDSIDTSPIHENDNDDIWGAATFAQTAPRQGLLSWNRFLDGQEFSPVRLLSEAASQTYDSLWNLVWSAEHGKRLAVANSDELYHALSNLAIGRSSSFFSWDQENTRFQVKVNEFSLTGHSPDSTAALWKIFRDCGTSFRMVKLFCETEKLLNPTLVALQKSGMHVLHAIERHQSIAQRQELTFLELKYSVEKCAEVNYLVASIISQVKSLNRQTHCLTRVIHIIDDAWVSQVHLRPILTHLAACLMEPALRTTSEQLELRPGYSAIQPESHWLLSELLPELRDSFDETIKCLNAIREYALWTAPRPSSHTSLTLIHHWLDLTRIQNEASEHEKNFIGLHLGAKEQPYSDIDVEIHTASDANASRSNPFSIDIGSFATCRGEVLMDHGSKNPLHNATIAFLGGTTPELPDLSPLQALRLSISPLIQVQHRVSSYKLLQILVLHHNLVHHLELLYSFLLLGDGSFAMRLSKALFSAEQNSTEGRRMTGLSDGLRIENRELWPPASSELRLALTGLLSTTRSGASKEGVLDCISFAIRELSDEELELCRNVHSVHALDFLRLVYVPSSSLLELVITPPILDKYDRIFKFVLVLLRLHAITQVLVANVVCGLSITPQSRVYHRLCVELHHLTSSSLDFALNEAINGPWTRFSNHVTKISNFLALGHYEESMRLTGSIAQLRNMHEECLDEILTALLLNKKQAKTYSKFSELLTMGLKLASLSSSSFHTGEVVDSLYKDFTLCLISWISQIKQLSNSGDVALRRLEILLLKLDMNKYYEFKAA